MSADDVINEAKSALGGTIRADRESEAARRVIEDLLALAEEQAEQIDGMVTKDWHGLRAILDQVYPADVFPTLPDRASRDDGPRIVSLLRNLDRAEATIARVRALVTGGEQREATSLTRMFDGDPFPALFTTADIRAALGGGQP